MRKTRVIQLLGLSLIGIGIVLSELVTLGVTADAVSHAEHVGHMSHTDSQREQTPDSLRLDITQLPVAVDGSTTPELIPDAWAYRHFLATAAVPREPSQEQLRRQRGRLAAIGLSDEDMERFREAVAPLGWSLEDTAAERAKWTSREAAATNSGRAVAKSLKEQETTALDAARTRLAVLLTQEGSELLKQYIQHSVKRQIKIYGSVPSQQ